jgi:hypothetical protein
MGRVVQRALPKLSPGERLDGFDLTFPGFDLTFPARSDGARGTGVLTGRSVDAAGRPVAGARVRLHEVRRFGSSVALDLWGVATTAADGGWRIEGLAADMLRLRIERSGYLAVERDGVRVGDDATDVGELAMAPALRLEGRVIDAGGLPVRGRAVRVESGRVREVVRTGLDGAFAFADGFPGRWTARVAEPTAGAPVVVELPASAPVVLVADDGDSPEAGPFVEGVVLDVHGRPAPGTQLTWHRPGETKGTWVPVGLDGRFRVAVPGRVRLEVGWVSWSDESERARQLWDAVEVEPGPADVHLRAHSGLSLEGTVAGAEGALHVRAEIEAEDAPLGGARARAPVLPDGTFRLEGLRRAAYTLHLEGDAAWADPVRVVVAGGAERIVVRASPTLSIAGRVVGPAERDHGMLKLKVERIGDEPRGKGSRIARSGEAFRVDGLRPGRYRLTAATGTRRVDVEADAGDRDVVIDLR